MSSPQPENLLNRADFAAPDYFSLRGGGRCYVTDLQPADITIKGIAHRLALDNRWRGETVYPWSVASHSLLCVRLAKADSVEDRGLLAAILMHDAHEAYTRDLPRDIKGLPGMESFRALCDDVERRINAKYGLEIDAAKQRQIKLYDNLAARLEYAEIVHGEGHGPNCPLVSWWHAEQEFLTVAGHLGVRD